MVLYHSNPKETKPPRNSISSSASRHPNRQLTCPLKEHILQGKLEMGVETLASISTSLSLQEKEEEEGRNEERGREGRRKFALGILPSSTHSVNITEHHHLLITVPGAGEKEVNDTDKSHCPHGVHQPAGETDHEIQSVGW